MTISRRDLLKTGVMATVVASLTGSETTHAAAPAQTMIGAPFEKREKVRIGIVGVGERGKSMIHDFLGIEPLEIVALCDNVKANAEQGRAMLEKAGRPLPAMFTDATGRLKSCAPATTSILSIHRLPGNGMLPSLLLQWNTASTSASRCRWRQTCRTSGSSSRPASGHAVTA